MEKALTKVGSIKAAAGSLWIAKKAKEELKDISQDLSVSPPSLLSFSRFPYILFISKFAYNLIHFLLLLLGFRLLSNFAVHLLRSVDLIPNSHFLACICVWVVANWWLGGVLYWIFGLLPYLLNQEREMSCPANCCYVKFCPANCWFFSILRCSESKIFLCVWN